MSMDEIKRVMDGHVDGLMELDGVVGIAIGALDDGQYCIRVYVEKDSEALRGAIPREIEGYPVDVEVSGRFRAMNEEDE